MKKFGLCLPTAGISLFYQVSYEHSRHNKGLEKSLIENGAGIERFWLHFLEKEKPTESADIQEHLRFRLNKESILDLIDKMCYATFLYFFFIIVLQLKGNTLYECKILFQSCLIRNIKPILI